jgi:hypothetical protein
VGDGGFRSFRVRLKAGRTVDEGVFHVIVRTGSDGDGEETLTVPVHVRNKEG